MAPDYGSQKGQMQPASQAVGAAAPDSDSGWYAAGAEQLTSAIQRKVVDFLRKRGGCHGIDVNFAAYELEISLGGPSPNPVERLLVADVVTCWLRYTAMQWAHAWWLEQPRDEDNQSDFYARRMEHAHVGYLRALKALCQVRKLWSPSVQVNIANQQVNVAG